MMTSQTRRLLEAALDELKRNGYMALAILLDRKSDESNPLGSAVEVLCNFTNDQKVVSAMLRESISVLTDPDPDESARLKIQ